jgi:hypothetical protein
MDVACPSLPLNALTTRKHTPRMAADDGRLAVCSLDVQLINIESSSSLCAVQVIAQPFLYKAGSTILSRNLLRNMRIPFDTSRLDMSCPGFNHEVKFVGSSATG